MGLSKEDIPREIEAAVLDSLGKARGQEWLTYALNTVSRLEQDWDFGVLRLLGVADSLLLVVEDFMEDEESLLKIPFDVKAGCDEIAALKICRNRNVPFVKKSDSTTGIFMMEYVPPVKKTLTPFQAFVLADVVQTPLKNITHSFPSLEERVEEQVGEAHWRQSMPGHPHIPDLDLAVKTLETLLATQTKEELLHGDFRNRNIIPSQYGSVVINPKPCVGDSLYDIAVWLVDTGEYEHVAVIQRLLDESSRLIPWVWSLSVLNGNAETAAEVLKDQALKWLDQRTIKSY